LLQTHLDLDLALNYEDGGISGAATLALKNIGSRAVARVPVQLGRLMTVSGVTDGVGHAVPYDQDVVTYDDWPQLQVTQAYLSPPIAIAPGATVSFTINYSGTLVGYTESGMLYVQDRVDHDFTIIRTDARAIPVVSGPSIADLKSRLYEDFGFTARITVPAGLTVATATPETDRIVEGETVTWGFEGHQPVPFLNIAVAPFQTLESGGVRVYYFPDDSSGARMVMEAIEGARQLYSQWLGPLESDVTLHVIEIPEGWGSQASLTGGIIQTADAFRNREALTSLYHELSHLWDIKDLDAPSCRWTEGLAMFMQQRVARELDDGEELDSYMDRVADARRKSLDQVPELSTVPFIEYGQQNMTDYSYRTGQLMFYILYRVMGEDDFDAAMRRFRDASLVQGSTAGQFDDVLREQAPGPVNAILDDWFLTAQWADRLKAGESLESMIDGYRR
jgi:hypothetical protein